MAIMTLAKDISDLKRRLGKILVAYTLDGKPVLCKDLKAENAMAVLLKDALKPNLVQTLAGTPAFVHCGPFANIAHGCNSITATRLAMTYADYTVTEAGFGADLGAEKFLDVKCRISGLVPNAVAVVATVRALKLHGGCDKDMLQQENLSALASGMPNLIRHVQNIANVYKLPVVVAINRFTTDTPKEIELVVHTVQSQCGVKAIACDVWAKGGSGATQLADEVAQLCQQQSNHNFQFAYQDNANITEKVDAIAKKIYGAGGVEWSDKALSSLKHLQKLGCDKLPVVIAKTQYSFSDNAKLLGAPSGFTLKVRDVEARLGAGFVVVIAGNMLLMPGLPAKPNAVGMTIDNKGNIEGLY